MVVDRSAGRVPPVPPPDAIPEHLLRQGDPAAMSVEPYDRAPGADTPAGYWHAHIRLGFSVFIGETLIVMIYLATTPAGPNRGVLWTMAAFWLTAGLAGLSTGRWASTRPWRMWYSTIWTVLSIVAIAGFVALDSGLASPVRSLLFLPFAYAALMFRPRATALCALVDLVATGLLGIFDRGAALTGSQALTYYGVLVGAAVLALAASANRTRLEQHEERLKARLVELAAIDDLTGCAVRRVFHRRAEEEISRALRHHRRVSLLMIDVDDFKSVNDTGGHPAGDALLSTIGAVLRSNARASDVVGRLGGDEFAVLMPETEPSEALALADRIRWDLQSTGQVSATLSIGVTGLRSVSPSAEQMLRDADRALYRVKDAGGDAALLLAEP